MRKENKLFFKVFFFILNLLVVGMVVGYSTRYDFIIYTLTLIGTLGWILFVMPTFFNHWGKSVYEYNKILDRSKEKKTYDK